MSEKWQAPGHICENNERMNAMTDSERQRMLMYVTTLFSEEHEGEIDFSKNGKLVIVLPEEYGSKHIVFESVDTFLQLLKKTLPDRELTQEQREILGDLAPAAGRCETKLWH